MSSGVRWERFARIAPEAHIASRDTVFRTGRELEAFYESGRLDCDTILARAESHGLSRGRAVDLGAGVGRVAFAMAAHFEAVLAVDAAPTMLAVLQSRAEARGIRNVVCAAADGGWQFPPADLVYSIFTLQHLSAGEIARSVERAGRALAPGGVAYLELDTRPRTAAYRLRNALPDAVLPRPWRRGLRTLRRSPGWLRALFRAAGLEIVEEHGAGGRRHAFILRRP